MSRAQAVGGPILTKPFRFLLGLFSIASVLILYRLATGLGGITAMNDGYPWGLWIAFDVVTAPRSPAAGMRWRCWSTC